MNKITVMGLVVHSIGPTQLVVRSNGQRVPSQICTSLPSKNLFEKLKREREKRDVFSEFSFNSAHNNHWLSVFPEDEGVLIM